MLKLCAAQLNLQFNQYRKSKKPKPLIWLDIGGGTGKIIGYSVRHNRIKF